MHSDVLVGTIIFVLLFLWYFEGKEYESGMAALVHSLYHFLSSITLCYFHTCHSSIVHPGINVHFDLLCLNKQCGKGICHRDFKLSESEENSYGFTFVGSVSMKTLLTFDPKIFAKI